MVEVAPCIVNGFYWSGSNRQSLPEKADRQRTFGGMTIYSQWLLMALALGNGLPPVMAQHCFMVAIADQRSMAFARLRLFPPPVGKSVSAFAVMKKTPFKNFIN